MQRYSCILFLLFNYLFALQSTNANPSNLNTLTVATYSEHLSIFSSSLINNKCPDLAKFKAHDNQVLLEFYFFCNALKRAGINPNYKFVDYPLMARILLENAKGNVNLIGFGLWSSNINTKLNYVSIPILEKGEFVKGLYTASFNESLINNASLEKIKSLKAVTNEHWHLDNEALKCLANHQIYRLGYSEMYGSINKGHADFVLKSFTKAPSLSSNLFGYNMKPIKGFKVKINDELRYVISKNMPNADALLAKLNLGLTTLKNEGLINHYYKKIGIINDAVKDWKALTCKTQ